MRILIVEDEPDLLKSLARALRDEGYAVDTASDGEEGLYKAENWNYDAILLDIMLPKIDGISLLARVRKTKQTPVLLLTARDGLNDRVQGLDKGADDYLVKPFDLVEYLALHSEQVVTRTELYEHLFDENDSSLSNLLDVHVSNVRKKLGHDFILTRRGQGYCIHV
jgi:two-component system, OmpR family, response regulator